MADFWDIIKNAGFGFLSGGPAGAVAGGLSTAAQKSGGGPQNAAATHYYTGAAQRATEAGQNITALLPGIFAQAGYKFGPGANGQPGTFQQQPFSSIYTDPALGYDAFHAKSIQPLENQRIAQTAQLGAQKGMGQSQRGFGQNLINTNFAQGEAQANRDWGLQQRQRQDQYFGMGLNALQGQAGAGQAAAGGLTELGQYGQNRADIQNASVNTAMATIAGELLWRRHLADLRNAGNPVNNPSNYGPPSTGVLGPDPGSGGYGSVQNPFGAPSFYGSGG